MGLLELLGEHNNPGPHGGLDVGLPDPDGPARRSRLWGCLALAACIAWLALLVKVSDDAGEFLLFLTGSAAYVLAAQFIHPKPDMSNVGLLHGAIDHPFRYSDDVNRILAFLCAFLWPGKLLASSLATLVDNDE